MIEEIKYIADPSIIAEIKEFSNQGVLWEIIEGNKGGKIFNLFNEAILILENGSNPYVFIAGRLTEQSIDAAISLLVGREFPSVICNIKYHSFFLNKGWNFNVRAELKLKDFPKLVSLDSKLQIRRIDTLELFRACCWYRQRAALYGSAENFLLYGTGYALCLENQVISEMYADIGNGFAEISIVTSPNYRRKGYATVLVTQFIQKCQQMDITPVWTCDLDNQASLNTSFKLGFELSSYYIVLVPGKGNVI